jgi:RNA polymerase primary sigma factor
MSNQNFEQDVRTLVAGLDSTLDSVRRLVDWLGFDIQYNRSLSAVVGGWSPSVTSSLQIIGSNEAANYMFGYMELVDPSAQQCKLVASKLEHVSIILFKSTKKDHWALSIRSGEINLAAFQPDNLSGPISRALVSIKNSFDDGKLTASELFEANRILSSGTNDGELPQDNPKANPGYLTASEELELGYLIQAGGRAGDSARDKLVMRNQNLARNEGNKFFSHYRHFLPNVDVEDYHSAGYIGLIRAAEKYDPTLGYRFSTYATQWIRQSIGRMVENEGLTIRLPSHMVETVRQVKKFCSDYEQLNDRFPTDAQIEERFDLSHSKLALVHEAMNLRVFSLSENIPGTDLSVEETIVDGNQDELLTSVVDQYRHQAIESSLANVSEVEARVLRLRHGLIGQPRTLEQIGRELGLSRERVRQIESSALAKLRGQSGAMLRESELGEFVDGQNAIAHRKKRQPSNKILTTTNRESLDNTKATSSAFNEFCGPAIETTKTRGDLDGHARSAPSNESPEVPSQLTEHVTDHKLSPSSPSPESIIEDPIVKVNLDFETNAVSTEPLCNNCKVILPIKHNLKNEPFVRCRICNFHQLLRPTNSDRKH